MQENDEIDLFDLANRVVRLVAKNILIIIVSISLGSAAGYFFYQLTPKVYESEMLVKTYTLTKEISVPLTQDLDRLAKERNWIELAKKLNITVVEAKEIQGIQVMNSYMNRQDLGVYEKYMLLISINTTSPSKLPIFEKALIGYLDGNQFARQRQKLKESYFNKIVSQYDQELIQLEDLRTKFLKGDLYLRGRDNLILFDLTNINEKLIRFNQNRLKYLDSLELVREVEIVSGFTQFQIPFYPKLSKSIIFGALIGLIGAFLWIVVSEFRIALKARDHSKI